MNKKKTVMIASVLAVLSLVLVTVGTTVAYFTYKQNGTTLSTITSGTIKLHYKEVSGIGAGISITNATPSSNDSSKVSNNYFEFKITGAANDKMQVPYVVTARMSSDSDSVMGNIVDMYLTEVNNNVETPTLLFSTDIPVYNALQQYSKVTGYTEKIIYTDTVRNADYEKDFRLRMWIDEDAEFGEGTYNNKSFSVTVNVNAIGSLAALSGTGLEPVPTPDPTNPDPLDSVDPGDTKCVSGGYYGLQCSCDNRWIAWQDGDNYLNSSNQAMDKTRTLDKNYPPQNTYSCSCGNETGYVVNTGELFGHICEDVNSGGNQRGLLNELILADNEVITTAPTLTKASSTCTYNSETSSYDCVDNDASGLYKMSVTNSFGGGSGDTYYFRGDVTNNVVEFGTYKNDIYYGYYSSTSKSSQRYNTLSDCQTASSYNSNCTKKISAGDPIIWRVVRINEDGTTRLILDDNIEDNHSYPFNPNLNGTTNMYYSNANNTGSYMKKGLNDWYNENITGVSAERVATGNYFCEAIRARYSDSALSGSAPTAEYSSYTPVLNCATDGNGKGYINSAVGLITYDEAVLAGEYVYETNQKIYLYKNASGEVNENGCWTMSPAGSDSTPDARIWLIAYNGGFGNTTSYDYNSIHPVINLKNDTMATKNSTTGHYIVDVD